MPSIDRTDGGISDGWVGKVCHDQWGELYFSWVSRTGVKFVLYRIAAHRTGL